jgi:diketogulonate reductase-like aldo/keto reductase
MNDMKNIKLNDGVVVPMLGYGTGTAVRLSGKEESIDFIKMAYSEAKLSHLDCAQRYFNEESIAVAMRDLGIKRDDVFITTKSTWGFLSNRVCCILIHVTSLAIAPQLRMERLR